jgi:hypothetical protein
MFPDVAIKKYYDELGCRINTKPSNIDILKECITIYDRYMLLNKFNLIKVRGDNRFFHKNRHDDKTDLLCNKSLSEEWCGLSVRNFLKRKSIGKNIDRSIVPIISAHLELNKLKFLSKLCQYPKEQQKIIIQKAVHLLES